MVFAVIFNDIFLHELSHFLLLILQDFFLKRLCKIEIFHTIASYHIVLFAQLKLVSTSGFFLFSIVHALFSAEVVITQLGGIYCYAIKNVIFKRYWQFFLLEMIIGR